MIRPTNEIGTPLNIEDMSMYANEDRFSVMIHDKMDDLPKAENSGDSNSTTD